MIISHRKKFAFFANQRTGSKAVGIVLRLSNIFDEHDILIAQPFPATRTAEIKVPAYNLGDYQSFEVNHMTPADAIDAGFITLEQLREYDCYAFLREPKERFMATRASMQLNRFGRVEMPAYKEVRVPPSQFEFFFVGDEQVVTPLDFDNYEAEVKMLVEKLDGTQHMDIPAVVGTSAPYTARKITYNPAQHTRDYQLYRKMKVEQNAP